MEKHRSLFLKLKEHTGMFIPGETYECVSAYLMGYDEASNREIFMGFREWLVYKYKASNNLYWTEQVLEALFPTQKNSTIPDLKSKEMNRKAIDGFFDLFFEFEDEKKSKGVDYIFENYKRYIEKKFP